MGPVICVDLFIAPARVDIIPGVIQVHGDGRTFSSNSDPSASRGYIYIPLNDPTHPEIHMNRSGYFIPADDSDLSGIYYYEPSDKDKWTVTVSEDGSITATYDLVISGPLDKFGVAPHLNGTVTFTPNADGGFNYTMDRDGFPWAESYYYDGQGNVITIFQDPAVRGNPYDLFAIEPQPSLLAKAAKILGNYLLGLQPRTSSGHHKAE